MADDSRLDNIEKTLQAMHRTLVVIETDHGHKIDLALEGLAGVNQRLDGVDQRLDSVDQRLDRLEAGQARLEVDMVGVKKDLREIKTTVGLLHTIANDHENRLRQVEALVQDHLAEQHPHG